MSSPAPTPAAQASTSIDPMVTAASAVQVEINRHRATIESVVADAVNSHQIVMPHPLISLISRLSFDTSDGDFHPEYIAQKSA